MGEIESNRTTFFMCHVRDIADVKSLSGEVLHSRQKNRRNVGALAINAFTNIFMTQREFVDAGCDLDQRLDGIKAVSANLRLHRVTIRWKGITLDQNFVALRCRAIEARQ